MIGHASMECGASYISWWPDLTEYRSPGGDSRPVSGNANTWLIDISDPVRGEGCYPHFTSSPIKGLDEANVGDWWNDFRTRLSSRWFMNKTNCSWAVLTGLMVGGAGQDWVFKNFFERLSDPPSPVDCKTAADILTGKTEGALNFIKRYTLAQVVNPLANAVAYRTAILGYLKEGS
jgi:hypothetical protein